MTVMHIKPSTIVLLTTLRCTAACDNCCFGCTPEQGHAMTLDEMRSSLDLTGGECMMLGKDVLKVWLFADGPEAVIK